MTSRRVAIIGAGRFGEEHLQTYRAIAGTRITGVVDVNRERAAATADRFDTRAFSSVDELCEAANPDAVSVVVPAHTRGSIIHDLTAHGVAILIEKPLAATAHEAALLADAYRTQPVMTGHILRFANPYLRLRQAIVDWPSPRHGHLRRQRGADHLTDYPAEDVIGLTLIHDLEIAPWLMNASPETVAATGETDTDGRWIAVRATVTFDNASKCIVEAQWDASEVCDSATIDQTSLLITRDDSVVRDSKATMLTGPGAEHTYADALRAELEHFLECSERGEASQRLHIDDAARAVGLTAAVRKSLDEDGRRVQLS